MNLEELLEKMNPKDGAILLIVSPNNKIEIHTYGLENEQTNSILMYVGSSILEQQVKKGKINLSI